MSAHKKRGRRRVVLIVDDDRTLCELVEEILWQALDCKVIIAGNAGRALELLNALKVDLILLDFWLPDMDGLRLYDLIQRKPAYSSIPILFITAASQTPEFKLRNPHNFMAKPFDLDEFIERVRSMLFPGEKPGGDR